MAHEVKILYYGAAQEVTGRAAEDLVADDTCMLRMLLTEKYPGIRNISFRLARNGSMINKEVLLEEDDIIAVLPPFAGG
jgi:molybdopterin synthase sulfur carrier subunit